MTRVVLATLILNEMEWLPKLYEQHRNWPGLERWVFVEAADRVYAEVNPELVSLQGLSVDGTTEFLERLAKEDDRVEHVKFGASSHQRLDQGKCEAREKTVEAARRINPDAFIVLDADEFYTHEDQGRIGELFSLQCYRNYMSFVLRQVNPWHPPSVAHMPLFTYEVVGGFWSITHCHLFRFVRNIHYEANHNHPCDETGRDLYASHVDLTGPGYPVFVHMACASDTGMRHAKNAYYVARGEGRIDRRGWYVQSRAAYETWKPGDLLPRGAKIIRYRGPIPEVFR